MGSYFIWSHKNVRIGYSQPQPHKRMRFCSSPSSPIFSDRHTSIQLFWWLNFCINYSISQDQNQWIYLRPQHLSPVKFLVLMWQFCKDILLRWEYFVSLLSSKISIPPQKNGLIFDILPYPQFFLFQLYAYVTICCFPHLGLCLCMESNRFSSCIGVGPFFIHTINIWIVFALKILRAYISMSVVILIILLLLALYYRREICGLYGVKCWLQVIALSFPPLSVTSPLTREFLCLD